MENYRFEIRAHHGMCLAFFRGKGYSPEFVANMTKIKSSIKDNPLVKIVNHTEDICAFCPHNQAGKCDSFQKVLDYDNKVLQLCGLKSGDIIPFSEFENLVKEKILAPGNREKICGNCQWTDICH